MRQIPPKSPILKLIAYSLIMLSPGCTDPGHNDRVEVYVTKPDRSLLFSMTEQLSPVKAGTMDIPLIEIHPERRFQSMDGFGFALTGGSATLINSMSPEARRALLTELFGKEESSIGVSYLRISIGASDLSDRVFSYDDLEEGDTDTGMKKFSINTEKKDLIPVLREILSISPEIKILGSPWSAPLWMKTNGKSTGGSLKPEFYDAYALYFVKYIMSMADEGINLDAITIQNEPLHPGNNPSMYMTAAEQAEFIKKSLGPAFGRAGIKTKIVIYDHNPNRTDYPIEVLNDTAARQYVDGTAFHMYQGPVDSISEVHRVHPDKNLYFTEQWVGAPENFAEELKWHVRTLLIGAVRNWCKTVIEWNLAADKNQDPHTDGGCYNCLGAVTLNGDTLTRNVAYYIIAHASKFVTPGSVRIESNSTDQLPNVAFLTPEGKLVLIVLNDSEQLMQFGVKYQDRYIFSSLAAGAASTITW